MGEMWLNKGKNMNLLQNTNKQIEELKKFNEVNSIQKSKKLRNIKKVYREIPVSKKIKNWQQIKDKKKRKRKTVRSYKSYIVSDLWEKRKNRFWKKHKKECSICKNTKFVQLHHKIYSNEYGDEPDNHLVALCSKCHKEFHDYYGVKQNMIKDTEEFISEMKSSIHLKKEMESLDNWLQSM